MSEQTTVASVKHLPRDWRDDPRYVYIGRANKRQRLPASPFANPFQIGKHGDRDQVIEKYRDWLHSQPELIERARAELPGKILVCWCAPAKCHGNVLQELFDEEQS